MEATYMGGSSPRMDWSIDRSEFEPSYDIRVQACVPRLASPWVLSVRPFEPSPEPVDDAAQGA